MEQNVEKITMNNRMLAIVVRKAFDTPGLSFVTPDDFPFQLGVHISMAGANVKPHSHKPFAELKNLYPQEFFYVESGKIEIGLYNGKEMHKKVILDKGDMIVLNCPHDVRFIDDSKFVELKQGPYRGKDEEKEYF